MWSHITYNEMVKLFGADAATKLLQCVERLTSIKNEIIQFDKNIRWDTALNALNETNLAM